jgi:FixJ family two-component response regulator
VYFAVRVKPVIAIVDDEATVRDGLVRLLRTRGFAACGFASGREFLNSWQANPPQCIVLDLQLPDIHGCEVQQALNGAGAQFPVIILTACDSPTVKKECMRRGAVDYLYKPPDPGTLLKAITLALRVAG